MAAPSRRSEDSRAESLREAQRRLTQERIVDALIALISDEHPFEVSMADVARRAGISEPTLYRHFPTKRDLFAALATAQYRHLTERLQPGSVDELADALRVVYRRAESAEASVRWTLAAPDRERVPRPNAAARIAMLEHALSEPMAGLDDVDHQHLLRLALLLSSPIAWLYWQDYLGLDPDQAAATAAWALHQTAEAKESTRTARRPDTRVPRNQPD